MGKAIIFRGVAVATPIQTVNFVVPLVTGDDYVNQYSLLATAVTAPQKTSLTTFVDNLITAGIWDKVSQCYPMLGGLAGYTKDLKDLSNQRIWALPSASLSWDSTRNAPYLNPVGNAAGTPLTISGLAANNFCVLVAATARTNNRSVLQAAYSYGSNFTTLNSTQGGYIYPIWNTAASTSSLANYTGIANNIYISNEAAGSRKFYVKSNNSALLDAGNQTLSIVTSGTLSLALGSFFAAAAAAPCDIAFYGTMQMVVVCNSSLTTNELTTLTQEIYNFNAACGRHIAW